jgi:hypothetical protein
VKLPGLGDLTASVPAPLNLRWGKLFLPWDAYPMTESSWHLGLCSWSTCYVRRQWDGFSTRVDIFRCVWAPTANSLRARLLRPPLPEVMGSAMPIHCKEPPGMLDQGPVSMSRTNKRGREGKQVSKLCLPALIIGWRSHDVDYSQD